MSDFAEEYDEASEEVLAELKKTSGECRSCFSGETCTGNPKADQVFFVGVGRVMLALQCVCKRFAHLGIKAHCVGEINEPAIKKDDLLIAAIRLWRIPFPAGNCKESKRNSRLHHCTYWIKSEQSDERHCRLYGKNSKNYLEDEIDSCQPMTSLFEQAVLLVGDVLAKMIIEQRHLDMRSLWQYHAIWSEDYG